VKPIVADAGAVISDDGKYRYRLWREFGIREGRSLFPLRHFPPAHQDKRVLWIMLNPSTADATEDDPTIRKCMGFAALWEYGGIEVVNLYAFRTTKPGDLWGRDVRPIGPTNDRYIMEVLKQENVGKVVVAWGGAGRRRAARRKRDVLALVQFQNREPECLGITKEGDPFHPLMRPYKTPLEIFKGQSTA